MSLLAHVAKPRNAASMAQTSIEESLDLLLGSRQSFLEEIASKYPSTSFPGLPTRTVLVGMVESFLNGPAMNWEGSPGYPWATEYVSNRALIEGNYVEFVIAVVDMLERWRDTSHDDVRAMDGRHHIENGLFDPCRIFIKEEPHASRKFDSGKMRIIISVPATVSVAMGVLHQHQNDAEILMHHDIPAKPGMSTTDQGIAQVWDYIQKETATGPAVSTDVATWDWSVLMWLINLETDLTTLLQRCRGTPWERMIQNAAYCLAASLFVLSDGRMFSLLEPGGIRSGGRKTASGNSHMRHMLSAVVQRLITTNTTNHFAAAMGDDCVERLSGTVEEFKAAYQRLGFTLSDILVSGKDLPFDFCSHLFVDRHTAIPSSWARTFYRLIAKPYTEEDYETWLNEMRHLSDHRAGGIQLCDLVEFLRWARWLPPTPMQAQKDIVPQAGYLAMPNKSKKTEGKAHDAKAEEARRAAQSAKDKKAHEAAKRSAQHHEKPKKQKAPRAPKAPGFFENDYNKDHMSRQTSAKRLEMMMPGRETTNQTCRSSINGTVTRLGVNPGDPVLFPMGSLTTKSWQRWDPRRSRVRFMYTPIAGVFSTANKSGDVFMAWTSDPTAIIPGNQGEAMKFQPSVMGISTEPLELVLTGRQFNMESEFIRRSVYYEGKPAAEFDGGSLFLGFQGNEADNMVIGVLSVEYEFYLLDQRVPSIRSPKPLQCAIAEGAVSVPNGVAQFVVPTAVLVTPGSGIGVDLSDGTLTLQGPGVYELQVTIDPTALGAGAYTGSTISTTFIASAGVTVYGMAANTSTWLAAAGVTDFTNSLRQTVVICENTVATGKVSVNQSNSASSMMAVSVLIRVETKAFA